MDALLLLIALTAIAGVLIVPALRRRRETQGAMPGGRSATGPGRYGFAPTEALDIRLPGPDPQLVDALQETQRTQDWQPAARLLALTDDWELRWQRVQSLAGAALMELTESRRQQVAAGASAEAPGASPEVSLSKGAEGTGSAGSARDGRWLRNWRIERPEDAGGAEVFAQFLVWQAMADPGSPDVRIILDEARNACQDAARLAAPEDPVPLITEIFVARGLAWERAAFESLWAAVLERAPHHMGAHLAALPYWSEKGRGSREQAYAFARQAAGTAPEGSLLPALPLFAVYGHLPDANLVSGLYRSAVIEDAIQGAQYAVHHARAGHPVLPHVRHLLLCFLVRAERYAEAMAEVRAVDGYVGAVPWADGPDARAEYAAYRALAVAGYEAEGGSPAGLEPPSTSY